ncbi:hypothetical protein NMY3_01687 [Candidatus Nitrosocosmicus oleophilus]|jgi:hypothetical protein|uniref:Uncharacterized protein n=1 Tax=Candidatus Nitrosocosmicus oleophilus TaxID=1353260 RepID=A0A654LYQ7_9ARCH|nr:hypothetical protein NMY3_01687 [Candidatus Nitrosocosmicus oleophilus]
MFENRGSLNDNEHIDKINNIPKNVHKTMRVDNINFFRITNNSNNHLYISR